MARSRVVLPLDAWSAPNSLSLLGVFRYWLGKDRSLRMTLLRLRAMRGFISADVGSGASLLMRKQHIILKVESLHARWIMLATTTQYSLP
jgi:hypothetical protein